MNNRLFTCLTGTVLDLNKVIVVHPVTDEHSFTEAEWTYTVRVEGGDSIHIGSDSKEGVQADFSRMVEAWKNFVNGKT